MKKIKEDLCPKRVKIRLGWFGNRGWKTQAVYRDLGRYIVELRKTELLPLFGYSETVIVCINNRGKFSALETFGESYCPYD